MNPTWTRHEAIQDPISPDVLCFSTASGIIVILKGDLPYRDCCETTNPFPGASIQPLMAITAFSFTGIY
jgi:hypothetical protein